MFFCSGQWITIIFKMFFWESSEMDRKKIAYKREWSRALFRQLWACPWRFCCSYLAHLFPLLQVKDYLETLYFYNNDQAGNVSFWLLSNVYF